MKKVLKIILGIFLVLVLGLLGILTFEIEKNITNLTPQEETIKNERDFLDKYNINLKDFKNTYDYKEEIVDNNEEDYKFKTMSYNLEKSDELFIFIHPLGGTGHIMDPICKIFLDKGYGCITYDQRNSGNHPKDKNTFGIKEKNDLIELIGYLKKNYPKKEINIFAVSYGANTFLQAYPQIKDNINLIVLDSPMSNGEAMIDEGFMEVSKETGIPFDILKGLGNFGSRLLDGFSYKEANGLMKVKEINNPILIISNRDDRVISFDQSMDIYNKSKDKKELILSKSKHAEMYFNETEKYIESIYKFLEENK